MPEKATPAHYFALVPLSPTADTLVFTVPPALPPSVASADGTTYEAHIQSLLNTHLSPQHKKVILPTAREFSSALVQAHRKGERAWHVKAWRGSKEGYLYFLPGGMLFGFRKPVLWFPFARIEQVAYSSVLQRTFNLTVSVREGEEVRDVEFAMLDQADHAGVDGYVRAHGLQDASLAAGRRAERSKGVKREVGAEGGEEEDEEGELARAERELQDAEDAEEEDFDPGSGGESDGSGESSGEEDADGDGGGGGEEEDADVDEEGEE